MKLSGEIIEIDPHISKRWENDKSFYIEKYCDRVIQFAESVASHTQNPLSWEELKDFVGKPIWVEGQSHKHWCLIKKVYYDDFLKQNRVDLVYINHVGRPQTYTRKENNYGKTWNAYRKENE